MTPSGEPPEGGRPALLDIHGGGFVVGSIEMEHGFAAQVVRRLGVVVAVVEYRLAPEHPFPAGIEDCYAALSWLHDDAGDVPFAEVSRRGSEELLVALARGLAVVPG